MAEVGVLKAILSASKGARARELLVLLTAVTVVGYGSVNYADSPNDGSRLAVPESLVDRQTLAVDGGLSTLV